MTHELPTTGVSLTADLAIDADGRPLSIKAAGGLMTIEVPDLATGLELVRLGSPKGFKLSRVKQILDVLSRFGLQLTLTARGRPVARLGDEISSGILAVFGLRQCQIRPLNLIRSAIRRRHVGE